MTASPIAVPLPHSRRVADSTLAGDLRKLEDAADTAAAYGRFNEADSLDQLVEALAGR